MSKYIKCQMTKSIFILHRYEKYINFKRDIFILTVCNACTALHVSGASVLRMHIENGTEASSPPHLLHLPKNYIKC